MPRRLGKASAEKRIRTSGRFRLRKPQWIDTHPNVHGTLPEKMVYSELSRRGIPFLFLNDIRFQLPEIEFDQYFQADFVIPSIKLIIEVQGAYWHSQPDTIESDAFKFAIYETAGYKVLAWWDYDILYRLQDLFSETPELSALTAPTGRNVSTELPVVRRTKVDTSQGIRTLNARRKVQKTPSTKRRTLRKAKSVRRV